MATNYYSQIQQLYVAYFNRPADRAGLEYWNNVVAAANGDITAVSAGFVASTEFATRYAGMDAATVHGHIFQHMFGRPLQLGGVYVGLPAGPITDKVVKHFADGASVTDRAALENKVKAALGFTAEIDTAAEAASYTGPAVLTAVNTFLSSVTAEASSLPANFSGVVPAIFQYARTSLSAQADVIAGSNDNDTFTAPLVDGAGTLQSGDDLHGGAGSDRLNAELSDAEEGTLELTSRALETVSIRAVASIADVNNTTPARSVIVMPDRADGVTQWESHRSSTDLIIDGIRLLPTQVTKDVTIVMQSTDAGNVDFGVYFEQDAVRGETPNVLRTQLLDTRGAAANGSPLADNPYNGFAIYFNGVKTVITSDAILAAKTYDALFSALETAVRAIPALSKVTLTKGAFQAVDTQGKPQSGTEIVLTAPAGNVFSHGEGSGWLAPSLNFSNTLARLLLGDTWHAGATIVLDDVGRGGTGGDLVVGSHATGETASPFNGIARFDIEVRDSSKLQTISSTTQALREVVLKNGVTSDHGSGPANRGDLTVLGTTGPVVSGTGSDALPGDRAHNEFGFSDVVVIDAAAMTGKISFDAEITAAALGLPPSQFLGGTDFLYSGGSNDDSMHVTIDGGVLASNARKLTGRSDILFKANGGAGNDDVKVVVKNGTASLGHNVFLNGGAGNDTLRMEGAANAIIGFDAGPFGSDKLIGFTSGAGTGNDQLDFSALGGRGAAFSGTAISNANNAITVQLQTGANDTIAEIAALYADGATATKHVFVAYDAGNVGKVYAVVDGVASGVEVTLVGSVDLSDTAWSTLVAANFS